MDSTPELTHLLHFTRRHLRQRRVRRWMMWATFAVAAFAIAGVLVDQPYAGPFLLPLVPLAGFVGYLRRGPRDQAIAQLLDEKLKLQELLASGLSCRDKPDGASQLIVAQAESAAGRIDRTSVAPAGSITRSETSAGLILAMALVGGIMFHPAPRPVNEIERTRTSLVDPSRTEPRPDAPGRSERADNRREEVEPQSEMRQDSQPLTGRSDARANAHRESSDAAGEGVAASPSHSTMPLPPARSSITKPSTSSEAEAGMGADAQPADRLPDASFSPLAPRRPIALEHTALPEPAARERAKAAMDTEAIDPGARDLIRAYFELDEPR